MSLINSKSERDFGILDVSNYPEEPTIDDYNDVPVKGYGAALRYAWKEEDDDVKEVSEEEKEEEAGIGIGRGELGFTDFPISDLRRYEYDDEFIYDHDVPIDGDFPISDDFPIVEGSGSGKEKMEEEEEEKSKLNDLKVV